MQLIMTAVFERRGAKPVDVPIYEHKGKKWISGMIVCAALGYSHDTLRNLWKRHKDTLTRHSIVEAIPSAGVGGMTATRFFTLEGARMVAARCQARMEVAADFVLFLALVEKNELTSEAIITPAPARPSWLDMPLSLLLREWFWGGRHG